MDVTPESPRSLHVITGGPGAGKTTLVDALERDGFTRSIEVGRQIIQEQTAIGGRGLPWVDPPLFAELMLSREMQSYHALSAQPGVVVFDRGIPDVAGYLRVTGHAIPDHVWNAATQLRYAHRVFIVPPWPEIYAGDAERKQTMAEAARTYDAMVDVYGELGYELMEVPRMPLSERVEFVKQQLSTARGSAFRRTRPG